MKLLVVCLVGIGLAACTSMGLHSLQARSGVDFGPPDSLSLCLLLDDGISEQRAREIIDEAWAEEGRLYGLAIRVASVSPWPRPAFTADGLMEALLRVPLPGHCDRVFALLGRHFGDFLWGLVGLPEVLGAVDDNTLTHGYAVVQRASLNQVFMSPTGIVRHEIYHLLGCAEHFNMAGCYEQIAALKRQRRQDGADFFPAWDAINERALLSRDAVNARLQALTGAPAVGDGPR
jgi:hypothetical protein